MIAPLDVSIILPSIRPVQLSNCLDSIFLYSQDVKYEIIVVAPFVFDDHPFVTHILETSSEGVYKAVSVAMKSALGKYIIHIPDDCRATQCWASQMIRFMEMQNDLCEGNFRHFDANGERPQPGVYGKLYAPFLCIRRDIVEQLSGLMDWPYYRSFWGDPDLSLRVWNAGVKVKTCPDAWIYHADADDEAHSKSYSISFERDKSQFISRWHKVYGDLKSEFQGSIPIEDPYIDQKLPPETCTQLSIYLRRCNWKMVKRIISSEVECLYTEGLPDLYKVVIQTRYILIKRKLLLDVVNWIRSHSHCNFVYPEKDLSIANCLTDAINHSFLVCKQNIQRVLRFMHRQLFRFDKSRYKLQ